MIAQVSEEGKKIKFLYMIPDFQNPSGESLTLEERKMLVALAEKYDFLIVEDSPYRELRYEGEHIPTMYSLSPDHVVHLGSFSKIFAPGFRLGWAIAHPDILDKIYVCKQSLDLCPPILDQYVAAEFLSSGRLDENLKKSVALYKGKRDLLLSLLNEHMPQGVKWTHPEGGLFLFLTMPEGFEAVKFYDKSLDAGVAYVAGEFFHPDGSGKNTMRLNFSFMTEEKIRAGIKLLAELLKTAL
jgi:2-aminoadipate transaminase